MAGDEVDDRLAQFRIGCPRRHHAADLVAVIDPAGIPHASFAIDEHHLRGDAHIERLGQPEVAVEIDRKGDLEVAAIGLDLLGGVDLTDHADEADPFVSELLRELPEHRRVVLGERTGGMEEGKADRPTIGPEEIGKGHAIAALRLQFEPLGGDRLASRGVKRPHRRISRQQRGASQRRQQTQKPSQSHRGTHLNVFP